MRTEELHALSELICGQLPGRWRYERRRNIACGKLRHRSLVLDVETGVELTIIPTDDENLVLIEQQASQDAFDSRSIWHISGAVVLPSVTLDVTDGLPTMLRIIREDVLPVALIAHQGMVARCKEAEAGYKRQEVVAEALGLDLPHWAKTGRRDVLVRQVTSPTEVVDIEARAGGETKVTIHGLGADAIKALLRSLGLET